MIDRTILVVGAGGFLVALGAMQMMGSSDAGSADIAAAAVPAAAPAAPPPPPPPPMPEHIGRVSANGMMTLNRQPDGHFHTQLEIGGVAIPMVVDTGATQVVLTEADAARAGIRPAYAAFNRSAQTAGGLVVVAPVRLERVKLGHIELHDVEASVVRGSALPQSLLGQSVLNRVNSITIENGEMRLR